MKKEGHGKTSQIRGDRERERERERERLHGEEIEDDSSWDKD